MLRSYGFEEKLGMMDPASVQAILFETAREWAIEFDPNSLITLFRAWSKFDVERDLAEIKAPLMYVLCDTDEWFPASLGEEVMTKLNAAGVDATLHLIHSDFGHYATAEEPEKWVPEARVFLEAASQR